MRRAEMVFALGILAFGALWLEEALKLPYFVEEVPGPGFLPFWLSMGIIAMGLALTVRAVRPRSTLVEGEGWPDADGWARIGMLLGALALALALLDRLGFLVVTALFVAAVARGLGMRSLPVLASVPILSAAALYGIFAVWLRVPLPTGVLGFL